MTSLGTQKQKRGVLEPLQALATRHQAKNAMWHCGWPGKRSVLVSSHLQTDTIQGDVHAAMSPSRRKLERIPPEIWQDIICRACVDGGGTGRALSLSCKFFREQALNARFHSLSFRSTNRLLIFLNALRFLPKECTPKIHHIFLTPSRYNGPLPRSLRHLAGDVRPLGSGRPMDPADFYANATEAILSLASRQLRTLCLVANLPVPLRHFAQKLPRLEELSLWNHPLCDRPATGMHAQQPSSRPVDDSQADASPASPAALFPLLRRFHYVLTDTHMSFEKVIACLPLVAPQQLTHLRLSGVTYANEGLPHLLAEMLGIPDPRPLRERIRQGEANTQVIPIGAIFPHLRHVVVYAMQPRPDDSDPLASSKWATLLGLLRDLERTSKRVHGMQMVVLERSWLRNSRWAARLRADWIQRMSGGRGCWVASEAEESKIEGPLDTSTLTGQ